MKKHLSLVYTVLLLSAAHANAYDLVTSPYLLGDWGGTRSSLIDQGVSFTLGYGSEIANNLSGGTKEYTAYTDQWVFGAGLDSAKLGAWKGGTAQIMITNRNGENLGGVAEIHNDMLLQEVYGRGQTWHMTQFWINQKFFDDSLQLKLGRMTVGEDFASFSCDFQNLSFCGAQPGNIVGSYWVNWPTSQWASRLKFHATEETFWQIGAYQVNPLYVDDDYARNHGMSLDNPSGTTGYLTPLEFAWNPKLVNSLPGSYKFGVWYNNSVGKDVTTGQPRSGQYGGYISFVQQITGTEADPGFFVFLNISQADRTTAAVDRQISIGTQYHGAFNRHDDSIGFGLASTDNNGIGQEYDSEIYYSYSPIKSVFLRPNMQYVLQPGGTVDNHNALVAGLKTGIAF